MATAIELLQGHHTVRRHVTCVCSSTLTVEYRHGQVPTVPAVYLADRQHCTVVSWGQQAYGRLCWCDVDAGDV